jgi:hypothetical protein
MKKLSVIQIILGLLIIGSLAFWYLAVLDGYLTFEGTIPGTGLEAIVSRNPGSGLELGIWVCCYLALGLLITGFGIAGFVSGHRSESTGQKPGGWISVVQIALGALVIVSLVWFIGWVEFSYDTPVIVHEGVEVTLHYVSGWYMKMISWKIISFMQGIAVTGCGILQLRKTRGTAV